MTSALKLAEAVIDLLDPNERKQLLSKYVNPRGAVASDEQVANWERFKHLGQQIASELSPEESLSKILDDMRR